MNFFQIEKKKKKKKKKERKEKKEFNISTGVDKRISFFVEVYRVCCFDEYFSQLQEDIFNLDICK